MEFNFSKVLKFLEPLFAILILLVLIFLLIELKDYNELQEEINLNCGWEEEDYKCYCEKKDVYFHSENLQILEDLKGGNFREIEWD